MAHSDNSPQDTGNEVTELSPVKRALLEIRRLRAELENKRVTHEPVAIIGMAVRLPGGVHSPERFWKALVEGEDLITTVPAERWDARTYWNPDVDQPGTMSSIHGGFLSDIDAFDADFFGIHAREAESMDPQQRILLELTWEALERASIDPRSLMKKQVGVYVGMSNSDYSRFLTEDLRKIDGYTGTGSSWSIAAGRIAYFLGTNGPAVVFDTACSSSLVAVHHAVQELRRGGTELAIVGAANLILSPEMTIGFTRSRMLAKDGRCKTFDASADGYVRSEGCCVIVLKRLSDARRDGDHVLAEIHGSAINQDGRSAGITAPNGPAQEMVMRAALEDAKLESTTISYIEAHGTGTPLGDPMEVRAIGSVYGVGRDIASPLRIGSVKTNLGHTEAAAGLVGLIKVVLMMQPGHGIAPHLHFNQPSSQIDWTSCPLEVPVKVVPWGDKCDLYYAGVSSFGFSGTNAHLIVGSSNKLETSTESLPEVKDLLLCLSAMNASALKDMAKLYVQHLQQTTDSFPAICETATMGRAAFSCRLALRAPDAKFAAEALERWLAGEKVSELMTSEDGRAARFAPPEDEVDELIRAQRSFIEGASLRSLSLNLNGLKHKVQLPVYPFARKRYWFGDPQIERLAKSREFAWQRVCADSERQSRQAPLGWNPGRTSERLKSLKSLTLAHARNFLVVRGAFSVSSSGTAEEILKRCGILPIYRNLFDRWLQGLVEEGVLIQHDDFFSPVGVLQLEKLEHHWHQVERFLADDPGLLAYLRHCGLLLGDILTGHKNALETLFPDGSFALAEGLYETSVESRYFNPIVASALKAATQSMGSRRDVRILEIGGGTGGTTSSVLPHLLAEQTDYWFTDLSELFLGRAKRKFSKYEFLHYALFDLDRDVELQGFRTCTFDLIVAANVVHASRHIGKSLNRIRQLLMPGGILVLLETTQHHAWFDMSTGLIEGWQHFEDSIRRDHPLLSVEQWHAAFLENGFQDSMALPAATSPAADLGFHVLLARRNIADRVTALDHRSAAISEESRPQIGQGQYVGTEDTFDDDLSMLSADAMEQTVSLIVRQTVCNVLHLDITPEELGDRHRLSDLGMDSLIALELRSELAKRLKLEGKISSTIAFDTGSVGELKRSLLATLNEQHSTIKQLVPVAQTTVTAEQLHAMSDEDVEHLLKERLTKR